MNAKVNLPNLKRFTDRHGKRRVYYKPARGKLIPLPPEEETATFLAAYQAARDGSATPPPIGAAKVAPGSLAALVALYLTSPEWGRLAPSTKRSTRLILGSGPITG